MDFLKILGEELVKKLEEHELKTLIIEKLEAAKLIQNDSGDFIPQSKFSEKVTALNKQIEELNEQLTERNKSLEDLQKKQAAGEDIAAELAALKEKSAADTEALEKRLRNTEIEAAVEVALVAAQIQRPEWAKHIAKEIMEHSDKFVKLPSGKFSGIDEIVKEYTQSDVYKSWFGKTRINGEPPDPSDKDKDTEKTWRNKKASELTVTDKMVLKREDPEKYEKMFPVKIEE